MRFKAIRRKKNKVYIHSGTAPALFKEDYDFEELLGYGMMGPPEDYEIVTVELTVIEDQDDLSIC